MSFFTRVFRSKDSSATKKSAKSIASDRNGPAKPTWTDAWQRTDVAPEEVQHLVRACTQALKERGLQTPFMLLPFRPSSDTTITTRSFVRNYFNQSLKRGSPYAGDELAQELRLTDPMVLCSVLKWCWSRLPGGVVTWDAYELFKVGEQDAQFARDAFSTFIPISIDSDARTKIILDFFDLLAAIAAHAKSNGLGGRKLSRYAGWWAFEHSDTGNGFEMAYKNWASAADATSHLFFAYLRSLSPDATRGMSSISTLPIALQSLIQATEYPPETPALLQVSTTKVVMIVDTVSPTPFALLRRAKNFEYRDSDHHLQEFAGYEDPLRALTDECVRVLRCISSANQSNLVDSVVPNRDESWSRFEDLGFGGSLEPTMEEDASIPNPARKEFGGSLRSVPHSGGGDLGRPTTPSWADFMSSGFSDENTSPTPVVPLLLPPDKVLPPIPTVRGQSSQSHKRGLNDEQSIDPGELASITTLDLDDSFWWVWISSLAAEEPASRKAVFGRCALLETIIRNAKWLVLEEQVKGAAPEPEPGAYIVEKKRFFGFSTRRGMLSRRKSSAKKVTDVEEAYKRPNNQAPQSKTSIAPDQHARIQAAAAALQKRHREEQELVNGSKSPAVEDRAHSTKTNSVMTLQPSIMNEASHALQWASNYDKNAYRTAYLKDNRAGTGAIQEEPKEFPSDKPSPPSSSPATTTTRQPPPLSKDVPASFSTTPAPTVEAPAEKQTNGHGSAGAAKRTEQVAVEAPPKDSPDSEESNKLKKKPAPMKPTGAERSAVAAARAALEDKAKAAQEPPTRNGSAILKKKPAPKVDAEETPASEPRPVESPAHSPQAMNDHPKIRREAEYDALSRVNTNEQVAADSEFSRFDQGPLLEQPAFVPEDSPVKEIFLEKPVAPVPEEKVEPNSSPRALNPSQDRWAQIRKNAADRAALAEQRSSTADEDGNTSEEESFETRAARIKARVAELTGNMQAASRP
ncbi:hypothetical protein P175DRAFT_0540424 [Aspergillus ochraceoroseus IBT 24754]|uniref:Meiotically up-regulated protein Msb1/Mug8 domain-containing protein n=1 Tax=Aspergillus ochraceoroseus IBT 24754 TaxID=1392256 RepID=A0A2T5LML7_9EURO|nr:uncharacterized protein P175DRAFT_0540424 [Aspergillus ochraceoroseus IBT 24754]PTU17532.1 hypothetical protein P175DRAFT_0540424 [Aspergillus ochraceoroseus IBT 24754]